MSEHKLNIDVQQLAIAIQAIRNQLNIVEEIVQKALIEENDNDRKHSSMDTGN